MAPAAGQALLVEDLDLRQGPSVLRPQVIDDVLRNERSGGGVIRGSPRRRRYLVLGTVSLVVGLGTAAFTAGGGGDAAPGPRITPPVEMYSVEHAITTGEVPFPAPAAKSSSNAPVP